MAAMRPLMVERVIEMAMNLKKTAILGTIIFSACAFTYVDQNKVRLKKVRNFVTALISDEEDERIFAKFLYSGNKFSDDRSKKLAKDAIALVRSTLKTDRAHLQIYKYSDNPETILIPSAAEGAGNLPVEKPLRFELSSLSEPEIAVNPDDVYVVKFSEGQFYILFDEKNKIVSFAGIKLGGGVGMMKF